MFGRKLTVTLAAAAIAIIGAGYFASKSRSNDPRAPDARVSLALTPAEIPVSDTKASTISSQPTPEPDFYDVVTSLLPRAQAGDADASMRIASIYGNCWQVALNPKGFDADIELKSSVRKDLSAKLHSARDITFARCRHFSGQNIGPSAIRTMLEQAASQGNVAAQTQLFTEKALLSGDASTQSIGAAAERVLSSHDAEAFAALAPLMGRPAAGAQSTLAPLPAGTDVAEAAWNIAACRLGRDCSPHSPAVLQMCLGGGVNCELRDIESFYRQEMLPPAELTKLGQLVNQLVQGKNR